MRISRTTAPSATQPPTTHEYQGKNHAGCNPGLQRIVCPLLSRVSCPDIVKVLYLNCKYLRLGIGPFRPARGEFGDAGYLRTTCQPRYEDLSSQIDQKSGQLRVIAAAVVKQLRDDRTLSRIDRRDVLEQDLGSGLYSLIRSVRASISS